MKSNSIEFNCISPFTFSITHVSSQDSCTRSSSHIHDVCEIYVNVSGDVSFMVEGQRYNVEHGNVIITRPFEYHHCIYHSDLPHEHYWILFSCTGNEELLTPFFNRPTGIGNKIIPQRPEKLLQICQRLTEKRAPIEQYHDFFALLHLTHNGEVPEEDPLPAPLSQILEKIHHDFSAPIQIEAVAKEFFISVNTLERQFRRYLGVTPSEYLRQYRLAHASTLLREGATVSFAAEKCGYTDASRFISHFKAHFGKTPLQYKKIYKKEVL